MKTLSQEAQNRARNFIFERGRPLEQAKYAFYFEGGSRKAVLSALAAFQNPDGGFGHGLEPDLRTPHSSVIATTVGLQLLQELKAQVNHPLVQGAMRYLMATYDAERQVWPIIPPEVEAAPRAPWWTYSENVAENWGGYLVNPRAEIVGYLHDYRELVPDDVRARLTEAVVSFLDDHADEIGTEDIACYVRLVEASGLPDSIRSELVAKLRPVVDRLVVRDPTEWRKYVLTPMKVVETPDSPFAELLSEAMHENLDFTIEHQAETGAWEPEWTWGGLYPEAWQQAKREWSGVLTVRTLRILQVFGRLEA